MKGKMTVLTGFFFMALMLLVIPTTGSVISGRSTLVYQGKILNFQDYPESFTSDVGITTWDADIIDAEKVSSTITGEGVYIAVVDTGLKKNWRDYFPEERIVTEWGKSFIDKGVMRDDKTGVFVSNVIESNDFTGEHPHGTHVTSTIIGYSIRGMFIAGIAPNAKIIPVKVLEDYNGLGETFGTSEAVAAGITYVANLAKAHPDSRFVISMSLGSLSPISDVEKTAIDYAISQNVIVVASAGNDGLEGMGSPGSYAPVISVGASGWASYTDVYGYWGEWMMNGWWTQDVPEDNAYVSYITDFSAREINTNWPQQLDLVAPGSWVVGPYPAGPGQSHLPWWSNGNGNGVYGQYYYLGGTSMACPHVSAVAALMLQANPTLTQAQVEMLLRSSADPLTVTGQWVLDPNTGALDYITWGSNAVGAGLLQADSAVEAALNY